MADRVRKILTALILADDISDFLKSAPPGWRVHQLSGDRGRGMPRPYAGMDYH